MSTDAEDTISYNRSRGLEARMWKRLFLTASTNKKPENDCWP